MQKSWPLLIVYTLLVALLATIVTRSCRTVDVPATIVYYDTLYVKDTILRVDTIRQVAYVVVPEPSDTVVITKTDTVLAQNYAGTVQVDSTLSISYLTTVQGKLLAQRFSYEMLRPVRQRVIGVQKTVEKRDDRYRFTIYAFGGVSGLGQRKENSPPPSPNIGVGVPLLLAKQKFLVVYQYGGLGHQVSVGVPLR